MAHSHNHDLTGPKPLEIPAAFTYFCAALACVGFVTLFWVMKDDSFRAWKAYLIGFWFTLSLALSGPFICATQHLSIAGWSASIRRVPESFGAFLPFALLFTIAGVVGGGDKLYVWFDHAAVEGDHLLHLKAGFLNPEMFALISIGSVAAMAAVWFWNVRTSVKQDETGEYSLTNLMRAQSALFLVVFVPGFSALAWYWIMGLEPKWFSTMFNPYAFAGLFQSGLALTTLVVLWLMDRDYFGDTAGEDQVHALGQLVFGFTTFYAYIAFCQFMLIWYPAIPEEASWFAVRGVSPKVHTGWEMVQLFLPFGKFILPFLILLPQDIKKNKGNILRFVCYWLVLMQLYEVWYWVAPTATGGHGAAHFQWPWIELLVSLGFVGVFGLVVSRYLGMNSLVPVKDPFLEEAVPHTPHGTKPPANPDMVIS